jgi:acylphosphatase
MPRKHILVSGRVQGVGFRYHAHILAEACGLTGWVRNLDSGEVEMEIQGFQKDINKFLEQIDKISMFIRIDHMEIKDYNEIRESGFDIRY